MSKYSKYIIISVDINDNKNQIASCCNYKESCKLYREAKERYKNDDKIQSIQMIGKNESKEGYVFYTKSFNHINDTESQLNLGADCREIAKQIMNNIELLKQQQQYHTKMLNKYTKQIDTIEHKFELIHNKQFSSVTDEERYKLELANELIKLRLNRRNCKQQIKDLDNMLSQIRQSNLKSLYSYAKDRSKFRLTPEEYSNKIEEEVRYVNEAQKKMILNKYKNKFDRCIDDEKNQILFFYNKVGYAK